MKSRAGEIRKAVRSEPKGIIDGGDIDISITPFKEERCTRVTVDVRDAAMVQQGAENLLPEILKEAIRSAVHENYGKILDIVAEEIPKQREAIQKELWTQIAYAMRRELQIDDE